MGDWLSIIRAVGDAASRFFGVLGGQRVWIWCISPLSR